MPIFATHSRRAISVARFPSVGFNKARVVANRLRGPLDGDSYEPHQRKSFVGL